MRNGFLCSCAAVVLGTTLAAAQAPPPVGPTPVPPATSPVRDKTDLTFPPLPARVAPEDPGPNPCFPGGGAEPATPGRADWGDAGSPDGPSVRFWAGADYLLWWTRGSAAPPLVTASPASAGGILGPSTTVLAGGSNIDFGAFSGFRFTLGAWLNEEGTIGLEGGGLFLGSRAEDFSAGGNGGAGSPTVGRPFLNANTGRPDAELVALPGRLAGTVAVHSASRLDGGELNGLLNVCCGCCYRLDVLGGFRFFELNDRLGITENLAVPRGVSGLGGTTFGIQDEFDTADRFYGGQVGFRGEVRRDRLFVDLTGKVALGTVEEIADVRGVTVITPPGGAARVSPGGLLALPTNIGRHTQSHFAVLPEAGLDVGYQLSRCVAVSVGYNFLYLSDVARPGDQIDPVLNPTQLPALGSAGRLVGAPRPAFQFHETDFWAQGLRCGLEFRY